MKSDIVHDNFKKYLENSKMAVQAVNAYFLKLGLQSVINKSTVAEERKDWRQHSDDGDITLSGKYSIEVKHLSRAFTCFEDWPFRNDMIVTDAGRLKRCQVKPYRFFYINNDMTHAAVLKYTPERWVNEKRSDSRYGRGEKTFVIAKAKDAKFIDIRT